MDFDPGDRRRAAPASGLRAAIAPYQRPDLRRSLWQVVNTFVPYVLLWCLMARSVTYSYGLTLILAVIAGGFMIRIFIILHDCGHGSFFPAQRANDILGSLCGVLTFMPYLQWRHEHNLHHASSGDLEQREVGGDVVTLTVAEYLRLDRRGRCKYLLLRHPLVLLILGPVWKFLLLQRLPLPIARRRERRSVHATNAGILAMILILSWALGFKSYLLIQAPVFMAGTIPGFWIFYCIHQFEDAYWTRHEDWDFDAAALRGSSYLRLPRVLQWFTGSIGFHHVHHFSPRIPNYFLAASHHAHPRFQDVTTLTLGSTREVFALKLWDEERQRLVRLRDIEPQLSPRKEPCHAAGSNL